MSAIVILGHSGSGKTSVGAWVAKHLDMPCIDTDVKVLEHLGKTSMQSVWDEQGEESWHEAEAEIKGRGKTAIMRGAKAEAEKS